MPSGRLAATLLLVAALAATAQGQKNPYRNYNEEKFVQNMQTAGRNYGAVTAFVGKNEYDSAKAQLTRAREQLAITVQFWRDKSKPDAIRMLRDALGRMDDLDIALGKTPVDPSALREVSQRISAACDTCHRAYRDQDPATKTYRLKPGSVR